MLTVIYEGVWQADLKHRLADIPAVQEFRHRTARSAGNGVLFNRNQQVMLFRQCQDELFIQRFYKAHVGDSGAQRLGSLQCRRKQGAEVEYGNP